MNPMNEQMNNDKLVSEILPLEEVTQAIIIAAKRVRKPITEVIIVQQIVEELLNGGFSDEATEKLKNIFGTKFCVVKGLTEPTPVPTKKEKKEKKEKTGKEKVIGEPVIAVKEKKPRKKPAPKPVAEPMPTTPTTTQPVVDPIGQSEPPTVEEPAVVVEKKPRKKPVPKPVVENPLVEPMPTNQPVVDPIGQSEEPAVVVKVKKPKKKVVSKPVVEIVTTEEQQQPSIECEEQEQEEKLTTVPLLRQTNHFSPDGFSIDWKPELMEEELSDIDLEEEDEE